MKHYFKRVILETWPLRNTESIVINCINCLLDVAHFYNSIFRGRLSFPVAQLVEHGASNAKIMGSIPRESKS